MIMFLFVNVLLQKIFTLYELLEYEQVTWNWNFTTSFSIIPKKYLVAS